MKGCYGSKDCNERLINGDGVNWDGSNWVRITAASATLISVGFVQINTNKIVSQYNSSACAAVYCNDLVFNR